ncbi:hypothetical protein [Microbacterium sp. YY-01]|uniref:hypothetical protein n=1 Tax=Microbacterium sp. YY-01 TaxID=3421634 RepID=UPI003D1756A4
MQLTLRRARHRRILGYSAVLIGMFLSIWLGSVLRLDDWVRYPALFGHLAALVAGLGAAVLLESVALLWTIGRAEVADIWFIERIATPLAWLGISGLMATGAFLQANFASPLTVIKMLAVLIAALNGVAMTRMTAQLHRLPGTIRFRRVPWRLRFWCVTSALISQGAWWTAVVIGMLNTTS